MNPAAPVTFEAFLAHWIQQIARGRLRVVGEISDAVCATSDLSERLPLKGLSFPAPIVQAVCKHGALAMHVSASSQEYLVSLMHSRLLA